MALIQKIIRLSASVPGYNDHGVHEFSGAGKLQNFLSWLLLSLLVYVGVYFIFKQKEMLLIAFAVSVSVVVSLIIISISIEKYTPWEYKRWLRKYIIRYALYILATSLLF